MKKVEKIDAAEMCCEEHKVHEITEVVMSKMPNDIFLQELADFFKVFGDYTRVKILWALDQSELCVCDIGMVVGMSKSAVSHQLSTLKKANLVKFRRDGKNIYYSLKDDHVRQLIEVGLNHIQE